MIEVPANTPDPLVTLVDKAIADDDVLEIMDERGTTVAVLLPIGLYDDLVSEVTP